MTEQAQETNKSAPDFSHRIDTNFYESLMYTLRRAEGLSDLKIYEIANRLIVQADID